MTFECFCDKFDDLSVSDKLSIFNEYLVENGDECIYSFDEEFFDTMFESPIESARATYFGNIGNWCDEYIRFDVYGNLESLSEYDLLKEIEEHLEELYDRDHMWSNYIDDDEDDDLDEE